MFVDDSLIYSRFRLATKETAQICRHVRYFAVWQTDIGILR